MKPKYKIGDRVRIKDELHVYPLNHPSRKHEGTVMTVRKVYTNGDGDLMYYLMEEDKEECYGRGWAWGDHKIAGYAEEFEDSEPLTIPPSRR